ncbi:CPBP family intramembrane glutamic endopeptidase [Bdellovibrio sp. HCB288]|uniref:CPBP family intramembrane glutamic endopeptidase n=1 Tax=Bdellovibrio sp. HCB288 TaxID=3394355 RepID=UPI0039B5A1E0
MQNQLTYLFSLMSYLLLSFLYFVERDFSTAFWAWIGILIAKILIKPLRQHFYLFLTIGICFSFFRFLTIFDERYLAWPVDFFLTTLIGFIFLKYVLKKPVDRLKWSFSFSRWELASVFIINIPSIAILYWYYNAHPEVSNMWPVLNVPMWSLPILVLAIALVNGLREEIFYRGFIQNNTHTHSPVWYVVGLQAVLFGFLHFSNAFPQGWMGVLLTALWGAAIAIQYRIFKSFSLAWLTHAMADAIMFSIILMTR